MTKLLKVGEVAAQLGVSVGWVYKHARGDRKPELPSVKLGGAVRFREEQVQEFVVECQRIFEGHA